VGERGLAHVAILGIEVGEDNVLPAVGAVSQRHPPQLGIRNCERAKRQPSRGARVWP
jgi:hypothetical protein